MVVLLSGQIKNIGDFLITDRANKLIQEYVDPDTVILDRTKDLTEHLDTINKSRYVFLCGGPAYAPDIYKGIYPLVDDLSQIKVPIIPYGLGWCGRPFKKPMDFRFNQESEEFLRNVHEQIENSSCRDVITESILKNNGLENVKMTGCPVWYDLPSIGSELKKREFRNIVFTTPASIKFIGQNTRLMRLTRKIFPKARIIMSFHRGIWPDKHTSLKSAIGYVIMCALAKILIRNVEIRDVSYDLDKIAFYDDCDFHLGYRVHAHLYFLSKRLPSILINEDGRGEGMVTSLGMDVLNLHDPALLSKVESLLIKYRDGDLSDFEAVVAKLDESFSEMRNFLEGLNLETNVESNIS